MGDVMLEMMLGGSVAAQGTIPGPGPQEILNRYTLSPTHDTIYCGVMGGSEFITLAEIKTAIGLSAGTVWNSGVTWVKYMLDGHVLYMPLSTGYVGVSWQSLYQCGAVYGSDGTGTYPAPSNTPVKQNKVISWKGYRFLVRLPRVGLTDPLALGQSAIEPGSEWGRMMFPIASDVPASKTEAGEKWGSRNLAVGSTLILSQESQSDNTNNTIGPYQSVIQRANASKTNVGSVMHWRPVLELVL